MSKEKRATWWKMLYHQRAAISSVSDEDAGKGLKAAFAYFDGDEVDTDSLTPGAFTVFCVIRPYIDESIRDFEASVACGTGETAELWRGTRHQGDPRRAYRVQEDGAVLPV